MNTRVYIFIGPPGSGKGTLSQLCTEHLGWSQLSTGDLCRKHIQEKTEIGRQIDFAIKSGKLISDTLVTEMVCGWLTQHIGNSQTPIILDGYPRTVVQAEAFNQFIDAQESNVQLYVVRFFISDEQVVARLNARFICQNKECQVVYSGSLETALASGKEMACTRCSSSLGRRADDEAHAVRERLNIYHMNEQQLIDFYEQKNQSIFEFNVEKSVPEVFAEFKQLISAHELL